MTVFVRTVVLREACMFINSKHLRTIRLRFFKEKMLGFTQITQTVFMNQTSTRIIKYFE